MCVYACVCAVLLRLRSYPISLYRINERQRPIGHVPVDALSTAPTVLLRGRDKRKTTTDVPRVHSGILLRAYNLCIRRPSRDSAASRLTPSELFALHTSTVQHRGHPTWPTRLPCRILQALTIPRSNALHRSQSQQNENRTKLLGFTRKPNGNPLCYDPNPCDQANGVRNFPRIFNRSDFRMPTAFHGILFSSERPPPTETDASPQPSSPGGHGRRRCAVTRAA